MLVPGARNQMRLVASTQPSEGQGLFSQVTSCDNARRNINSVLRAIKSSIETGRSERDDFFQALNNLQKLKISFEPSRAAPRKRFECRTPQEQEVVLRFIGVGERHWMLDPEERLHVTRSVDSAIARLGELDSSFPDTFASLVGELVFARLDRFGGGSVSDLIGVIWLSPSADWNAIDYAENILHEYLHQALFLDELANTIFAESVPRMAEGDALVRSAILQRQRGYDKAYHSAFVAYTLFQFHRLSGTGSADLSELDPLLITLNELLDNSVLLTNHGRAILVDLVRHVLTLRD
jgi:hypothetical protein